LEAALQRRGVEVLHVADKDREGLLSAIDTAPSEAGLIVLGSQAHTTPVRLDRRTFWLSRDLPLRSKLTIEDQLELLRFKAAYESRHGHDLFGVRSEKTLATEELRLFLFDLMTLRGRRMVDIAIANRKASVHLRIRDVVVTSAKSFVPNLVGEFETVCGEVARRLSGAEVTAATSSEPSRANESTHGRVAAESG